MVAHIKEGNAVGFQIGSILALNSGTSMTTGWDQRFTRATHLRLCRPFGTRFIKPHPTRHRRAGLQALPSRHRLEAVPFPRLCFCRKRQRKHTVDGLKIRSLASTRASELAFCFPVLTPRNLRHSKRKMAIRNEARRAVRQTSARPGSAGESMPQKDPSAGGAAPNPLF
jgi:hypothetical protein